MLKLLCRKTDGIVGEVIVVRDGNHVFSDHEIATFNIIEAPNLTVDDVRRFIKSKRPIIKKVYKNLITGWTDKAPGESFVWDDNGQWKLLEDEHARRPCISPLSRTDLDDLQDKDTPRATAILILEKFSFPFTEDSKNQEKITIV